MEARLRDAERGAGCQDADDGREFGDAGHQGFSSGSVVGLGQNALPALGREDPALELGGHLGMGVWAAVAGPAAALSTTSLR